MSSPAMPMPSAAPMRALGDLIRFSTSLSAEHRRGVGALLDEIGLGIATLARVKERYPDDPGIQGATEQLCWEPVAEAYARLLAEWTADRAGSAAVFAVAEHGQVPSGVTP